VTILHILKTDALEDILAFCRITICNNKTHVLLRGKNMYSTKGFILTLAVIFILNTMCIQLVQGTQIDDVEQQLIEEILTLDSKILALRNEIEQLSLQNAELRKQLELKQKELSSLNENFKNRQNQLSRWLVFAFKGGVGNILPARGGAENLGDFSAASTTSCSSWNTIVI